MRALASSTSLAGAAIVPVALAGAVVGFSAQHAWAACTFAGGVFTCTGVTATAQSVNNVTLTTVTIDPTFNNPAAVTGNALQITSPAASSNNVTVTQSGAGHIRGTSTGVVLNNNGSGIMHVDLTGQVTGDGSYGILANAGAASTGMDIAVNEVHGGFVGLQVNQGGKGAINVISTGDVTGGWGGIDVQGNNTAATDITVSANNVSSFQYGIQVFNKGSGQTLVETSGTVTTSNTGISAGASGGGDVTVRASGTVTGGGTASGIGALISSATATGDVTVEAVDVTGGNEGIWAVNRGTGATRVTATGTVTSTATSAGGTAYGIFATGKGTDVEVSANEVSAQENGIVVSNTGSGVTSVIATGSVEAVNHAGILVTAINDDGSPGTDLTVQAVDVTAGGSGISVFNDGTGVTSIAATGTVTGETGSGIRALAMGTDLTIATTRVSGEEYGIYAESSGTGVTEISASDTVTGENQSGIYASATGTDLTIGAIEVSGGQFGIYAENNGTGATEVVATGPVDGDAQDGIRAVGFGTDVSIEAVDVSGGQFGIYAENNGSGATSVVAGDAVTGAAMDGIFAYNIGTDLTVDAAAVSGERNGIYAENRGTGATKVTSSGVVAGATQDGIHAYGAGTDLDVVAGNDVSGATNGIRALNEGAGSTSVTTSSVVSGGDSGITLFADNGPFAVRVQGGSVAATGAVSEAYAAAIHTSGAAGGTIDIAAGTVVDGAAGGIAIRDGDGSAGGTDAVDATDTTAGDVVVTTAGTVTGAAILGLGDDTFNLAGGSYTGTIHGDDTAATDADGDDMFNWTSGTLDGGFAGGNGSDVAAVSSGSYDGQQVLDGGDDTGTADGWTDTVTFSGLTFTAPGANIVNWENIVLDGGSMTISDGQIATGMEPGTGLTVTGGGTLDGGSNLNLLGNLIIASGSAFNATGGGSGLYAIAGSLTNNGVVTTQDGSAGDVVTVAGDLAGAGRFLVDVDLATLTADKLVIGGSVTGGPNLLGVSAYGNPAGETGTGAGAGIAVVDVSATGGTRAGDFTLEDGPIYAGAYTYNLNLENDGIWYLQTDFSDDLPSYEAYSAQLLGLVTVPTMQQRVGNRWNGREWVDSGARGAVWQIRAEDTEVWARFVGEYWHVEPTSSTSGWQGYDQTQWHLQGGVDALVRDWDDGSNLYLGLTGHYGEASASVDSRFGDSSMDTSGYGIGATATWLGGSGAYLDLQAAATWFDSNLSSDTSGKLVNGNDGFGYILSAEVGKSFDARNDWIVTPQAQLHYATADFDTFTDPYGARVSVDDAESLQLRLGVAAAREMRWTDRGMDQLSYLYGIANVIHEFETENSLMVSETSLVTESADWSAELGLGVTRNFDNNRYSVYGEASGSSPFENFGESYGFSGTFGLRVNF
ncbi:autotransporter outer membrane beta-barrel domain-containing protein [Tropicimonas sp.]|uniref:autotransporter outer membrane beta-barrel domain-containing protein n=1 Tax=Tropicimonas sp. TaxID=2067044 RepID=UPI003A8B577B